MFFERIATTYRVNIPTDSFIDMLDYESETCFDQLDIKLSEMGVRDVDYNGHYGPIVTFNVSVVDDNDHFKQQIVDVIEEHLQLVEQWKAAK